MPRKIHMRDQVGANKIEEIMTHYDRCSMDEWMVNFVLIGVFLLVGVYW
jgi:predicted nucleic acid-binding Zn ribbon protein